MSDQNDARFAMICEALDRGAGAGELARQYPDLAREIIDAAVWRDAAGPISPGPDDERMPYDAEVGSTEAHARRLMLRVARDLRAGRSGQGFAGILARCRELGMGPAALASRLRLGLAVLTKLDRRLIDPASVPVRVVESLAAALKVSPDAVAGHLALPPTLSFAASYRAPSAPALALQECRGSYSGEGDAGSTVPASPVSALPTHVQQAFADAVASAPDLTDDDRRVWLSERDREVQSS